MLKATLIFHDSSLLLCFFLLLFFSFPPATSFSLPSSPSLSLSLPTTLPPTLSASLCCTYFWILGSLCPLTAWCGVFGVLFTNLKININRRLVWLCPQEWGLGTRLELHRNTILTFPPPLHLKSPGPADEPDRVKTHKVNTVVNNNVA